MSEGAPPSPEAPVQFPEIAEEIERMIKVDQDMRQRNISEPEHWDESVDEDNTARMKEIVAEIGWPTISKVGKDTSHHAWLLVQHSDYEPSFQEECLALMKQQSPGEVDLRNIAYLEDRIRTGKDLPQIYGTQFRQINGEHIPRDIEDPEHVDGRRKQMGLDSLEENIQRMYKGYGAPNQS